jgi:hypothetical protein
MNLEDTYSLVVESKQDIENINLSYKGLKTLVGQKIPKRVEGSFDCYNNNLTSLEGAPEYVGGDFTCSDNNLTSLKGAPKYVGGDFRCPDNSLTSLRGAPKYVGGSFNCYRASLASLEGLPEYIGYDFYCDDYLKKGEDLYVIISSLIRGWYQGKKNTDKMLYRIKKLFSK